MKKLSSVILALSLTGCGSTGTADTTTAADTTAAAAAEDSAAPADDTAADTEADTEAADETSDGDNVIRVGATSTPHGEILNFVKDTLADEGYTLDIVIYDDYVLPNKALADGELDANYFQHTPYLNSFNASNGTDLVSAAKIHYEPFGIYGNGVSDLS